MTGACALTFLDQRVMLKICIRACLVAAIELHFDSDILSWPTLKWLWSTGIEHQPGPTDHAPQPHDDLRVLVQGYRPSFDTFASGPLARGGYVAS